MSPTRTWNRLLRRRTQTDEVPEPDAAEMGTAYGLDLAQLFNPPEAAPPAPAMPTWRARWARRLRKPSPA